VKIESILTPERTYSSIAAGSKKRAIEEAAIRISKGIEHLSAEDIYERLISREKIGTTAIGHGIAIPHCRMENCAEIVGALFRLDTPIDFGAFDEEPVKILFVLLVPTEEVEEHLHTLAMLAERFESEGYRRSLLTAMDDAELYKRAIADLPMHNSV
jgi:PTS system nitrogen regulatory IIA component